MNYIKALLAIGVSAIGAVVVALGTGATDVSDISAKNWLIAGVAVLGSGGLVWFTENGPAAPVIKAVTAFLTVGFGSLIIGLDDDILTQAEWLTALGAAVVATGVVYQVQNKLQKPA